MKKRPLPNLAELAQLAATLAKNTDADNPEGLARRAMSIWAACYSELEREARVACLVKDLHDDLGRIEDSTPKPPRGFPASFNDFLRIVIGRGSETKNLPEFKAFLTDWMHRQAAYLKNLPLDRAKPPSIDEIEAVLVRLRAKGLDEDEWTSYARNYAGFAKLKRSDHARLAASNPRPNRKPRKKVLGSDSA